MAKWEATQPQERGFPVVANTTLEQGALGDFETRLQRVESSPRIPFEFLDATEVVTATTLTAGTLTIDFEIQHNKAIVNWGAKMDTLVTTAGNVGFLYFGWRLTRLGDSVIVVTETDTIAVQWAWTADAASSRGFGSCAASYLVENLKPGSYRLTAYYRKNSVTGTFNVTNPWFQVHLPA